MFKYSVIDNIASVEANDGSKTILKLNNDGTVADVINQLDNSMVAKTKVESVFKPSSKRDSMTIYPDIKSRVANITSSAYDSLSISGNTNEFISMDFSEDTYEKIFNAMMSRFNKRPIIQHKCHNCGANVEIDEDKHVFVCPYCGSVYAIGTLNINDGRS